MSNAPYRLESYDEPKFSVKRLMQWGICIALGAFFMVVVFGFIFASVARGEEYSDEQIVNAIYHVEGGAKAQYAYGIRSIPYSSVAEARRICFNTVRNQRKRHAAHNCGKNFLQCLADRYCPIGCDNDRGTNKYWLRNLRKQLARKSKEEVKRGGGEWRINITLAQKSK